MSVLLAAFHSPDVLLLDEPFDGVDPLGVEATMDLIAEARLAGAAVLISTHRETPSQPGSARIYLLLRMGIRDRRADVRSQSCTRGDRQAHPRPERCECRREAL
jgi:ABC-type uncharacterized transport system ATPase subunit